MCQSLALMLGLSVSRDETRIDSTVECLALWQSGAHAFFALERAAAQLCVKMP